MSELRLYGKGRCRMAELKILPVPTRILTDADDIVDAIEYYAGEQVTADDLVCCAESVVAITQGRFVFPEQLHISRAARFRLPLYSGLRQPCQSAWDASP